MDAASVTTTLADTGIGRAYDEQEIRELAAEAAAWQSWDCNTPDAKRASWREGPPMASAWLCWLARPLPAKSRMSPKGYPPARSDADNDKGS